MFRKIVYSITSLLILSGGLAGIQRLTLKADLPFDYETGLTGVVVTSDNDLIQNGFKINAIESHPVSTDFQLEFILDNKSIGENVKLTFSYGGDSQNNLTVKLVPYYWNSFFIFISLIVGILFWLTAVFVISKKKNDKAACVLYWVLMLFGLATMTSSSTFYSNDLIGFLIRIAHTSSYIMGISFFLLFTFIFPVQRLKRNYQYFLIFVPTLVLSISIGFYQYISFNNPYSESVLVYGQLWQLTESLLLLSIPAGTINLIFSYRKINSKEERAKVEWLFWGLTAGVSPFLIFYIVPKVFPVPVFFKEEYLLAFLVIIPISFGIAVVRHKIFNIEIVVKRSIVYSIMTIFVVMFYFGIVSLISSFSHGHLGLYGDYTSLAVTFFIALFFNPVRSRLQKFVDRNLYKIKYDFEKAKRAFKNIIKECKTPGELGNAAVNEIDSLIPVKCIGFVVTDESGERLKILAHKQLDNLTNNISAFRVKHFESDFKLPFALEEKVEPGVPFDNKFERVLRKWDLCLVMPLVLDSNMVLGAFIFGEKLSNLRFMRNDIDLLNSLSNNTAFVLNRLQLQEKLLLEEIEKEKLEELNSLKSYFVSAVSHDLKTPLTSIKMFAEILQSNKNIPFEKIKEYMQIVEGESDRLTRLIDNVLDLAKIEKGIKDYNFCNLNLNQTLKEVFNSIEYLCKMQKFEIKTEIENEENIIWGDKDAVAEAIINIISNAIKYSPENKHLTIATGRENGYVWLSVKDKGIGISGENIKNIFAPFFRPEETTQIKGTGIGLAVVKHIMDAHKGKIEVDSVLGEGSTFSLYFPAKDND